MTFIISIGAYAVFNVALGINELIANAFAWVFAVLFRILPTKVGISCINTYKTAAFVQMFAFSVADFYPDY